MSELVISLALNIFLNIKNVEMKIKILYLFKLSYLNKFYDCACSPVLDMQTNVKSIIQASYKTFYKTGH